MYSFSYTRMCSYSAYVTCAVFAWRVPDACDVRRICMTCTWCMWRAPYLYGVYLIIMLSRLWKNVRLLCHVYRWRTSVSWRAVPIHPLYYSSSTCSYLFVASRIVCTLIRSTGLPALISRFRLFQQTLDTNDVISYFYVALGLHSEKYTSITLDFIMHTAMVAWQNSNAPNAW